MDYQTYYDRATQASNHVDAGEFEQALDILEALVRSEISDLDKAMMGLNVAIVCNKAGRHDEAWAWYDFGISLEERYCRFTVAEQKASQLAEQNRPADSLALYEYLLTKPYLTEADRLRISQNVDLLRKQAS